MKKMPRQKPAESKQDYGTPRRFIRAVEARFGLLEWDLAAHRENTKCGEFYYGPGSTHGEDTFAISWASRHPTGTLYLNPEFDDIARYVEKCAIESRSRHGLITVLTPASIGSVWFEEHVRGKAMVLGLSPRMTFDGTPPNPKTGKPDQYPKDLMLSVYGYGLHGFDTWRWDEVLND